MAKCARGLFAGFLMLVLLAAGCATETPTSQESPSAEADPTTSTATPATTPSAITTTPGATPSAGTTTPATAGLPAPPWAAAPLAQSQVPAVLVTEWTKAENKDSCAALTPDNLGAEGQGAVARRANFSRGWAVAWDKSGLPGTAASGVPCPTCGRGAFGVAGTGGTTTSEEARNLTNNWPNLKEWSDGSRAGYGREGSRGGMAPVGNKHLAFLYLNGVDCSYNVWSSVSQGHLEFLLDHLRFVGGAGR